MSREKQIEEIADILYKSDNKRNVVICGIEQVAEDIYNAGYRKQIVGEWVRDNEYKPHTCSNCRRFMTFQNLNFCPECGARMKGGVE